VPPIVYKLHFLSDLPGLILQVAGTPTHGVLVSVSVLAVAYTRILVSDRIGACPYRPFSNFIRQNYLNFDTDIFLTTESADFAQNWNKIYSKLTDNI